MKLGLIFLLVLATSIFAQKENSKKFGTLKIIVTGFEQNTGKLSLRLDNTKKSYEENSEPERAFYADIENGTVEINLDSLAFGEYAIKCYHDVNENRELDTNFFGIPSEDYGFSNNAPATFGPPSFEQAAFKFKSHNQIEKIELQ